MVAIIMSLGIGLVAIGVFGILSKLGILEYNFVYPMITFGLAMLGLALYGYSQVEE